MKIGGFRAASFVLIGLSLLGSRAPALELYSNNVDAGLPGPGLTPDGVWAWTSGPDAIFTDEVTETGGPDASQSFLQTTDATAANGTSWYFTRGFGQFSVWADETGPLAGGVDGSNDPGRYRFSMDVNVSGNNGGEGTTPLALGISATDMNYEATYNIDANNDGDFDDGAEVYNHGEIKPTVSVSGEWVNISFTFDQGTPQAIDSDIPLEHQVFSNGLALQWYASYSSGGFGLDADNVVNMDNFRIEFLDVAAPDGDHNEDGTIDAADYVAWRKLPDSYGGDPGGYDTWFGDFGMPSAGSGSAPVPEPATSSLVAVVALGCWIGTRRQRRTKQ
jgi:hypothetical protein